MRYEDGDIAMKIRWDHCIPVCGLLFQPVPIACLHKLVYLGYKTREITPATVWSASLLVLLLCGTLSLALGLWGTYLLLSRQSRILSAVPFVLFCVPATLAGAVYLVSFLIFLTIL